MFDISTIIGLILALFIGVTLGLIGSGGSILTVPILVYVVGLNPVIATAYSLFIVGSTAFVGSIRHSLDQNVNFKIVALFGIPSLLSVFFTRSTLVPLLPDEFVLKNDFIIPKSTLIMILFAVVMFAAASRMIKKSRQKVIGKPEAAAAVSLIFQGILIGLISGLVGAGGGFLIVPALLFFANLPMRKAVGTSLTIVSIQSLSGFLGDLSYQKIDWLLILSFSVISIFGLFIGIRLSKRIIDGNLRKIFGWFILAMSLYILTKEIIGY
ncbi:MAG TPA: sulfite exporter TauE/SafE family protein [Flavobacterium sp.]|nr:sulfite exporter TauE/SafE family protein [Flavobacterium sp.]